jgi:hypothetical protein
MHSLEAGDVMGDAHDNEFLAQLAGNPIAVDDHVRDGPFRA